METKLTPTEGEWEFKITPHKRHKDWVYFTIPHVTQKLIMKYSPDYNIYESNFKLLSDAGNTFQKCHLLPSQLLQQRDELMEALEELCEAHGGDMTTWLKAYDKATATISNIQKHQI